MNGVIEQLVEEVVEKAYSGKIYGVIPSRYIHHPIPKFFFSIEAANKYYREMKELLPKEDYDIPIAHDIIVYRMNEKPSIENIAYLLLGEYGEDMKRHRECVNKYRNRCISLEEQVLKYQKNLAFLIPIVSIGLVIIGVSGIIYGIYKEPKKALFEVLWGGILVMGGVTVGYISKKTGLNKLIGGFWNRCVEINWKWLNRI